MRNIQKFAAKGKASLRHISEDEVTSPVTDVNECLLYDITSDFFGVLKDMDLKDKKISSYNGTQQNLLNLSGQAVTTSEGSVFYQAAGEIRVQDLKTEPGLVLEVTGQFLKKEVPSKEFSLYTNYQLR